MAWLMKKNESIGLYENFSKIKHSIKSAVEK